MKIKLIFFISLVGLCLSGTSKAQTTTFSLHNELIFQMSQSYSGGSARMLGLGGSKVALGGDVSNIYLNPAGLGFYNNSEIMFSPQFDFTYSNTDFLGNTSGRGRLNFNIANLGIVFNKSKPVTDKGKWRGGSFAFSANRINDFNDNFRYSGFNTEQDIIDYAVDQDNFIGPTDFTDLLYNTTLTGDFYDIYEEGQEEILINGFAYDVNELYGPNLNPGDTLYFVDRNIYRGNDLAFPSEEFPTFQNEEIRSSGSQYAVSFSYGGNYADRIYFGAGVNLMTLDKQIERIYTEQPSNADLTALTLADYYSVSGSGINGTFGIIGRPITPLLIGLSYTTPTYYAFEESQDLELLAEFTNGFEEDFVELPVFFYDINMPSKLALGFTYFFGKSGFISADLKSMQVNNARVRNSGDEIFENNVNEITSLSLDQISSVSLGGELRKGIFRLRGGFSYTTDPSNATGIDYDRYMYSAGLGIRKKNFFADVTYTMNRYNQTFRPYPSTSAVIAPLASATVSNNYITTTIGFSFN